ncbi:MAG: formylglycine-generating enzyme family protein [Pseudomonadota bacterium]
MPPLIQTGLSTLLSDFIIADSSGAISVLEEHFTFRADEITKGYQDSYGYAITAITVGLAAPDQKLAFVQKILRSKITRDFAEPIEINYLQPFAQQRDIASDALRQQFIERLNQLIKHKDQLFQLQQFTQADLAALINYQSTETLTQSVLVELQSLTKVDETLAAFLSYEDLLGKAMLYFFYEIIRKDERVAKTQAALQREGLTLSVQNIETAVKTVHDNFNQAVASQSTQLVEIAQQLQNIQQAQSAWQTRSQLLSELTAQFSAWRELLNHQLEQLLNGVKQLCDIASEFVPKPLDYGYANKDRAYFVTEYIEGAIRPHPFRERDLPKVQALRDLLCDCVEDERQNRPDSARELVSQLEEIVSERQAEKGNFFEFETVTVNANGKITHRERKQARHQTEDLGNGVNLEMVYIPGGTFMMGSPENEKGHWSAEEPQHKVTIEPFYMSKYPVTQAQWEALMGNNPSYFKGENRPVETVSWHDAVAFCQRLSEKTGKSYGLPSEAQWEYSCRAGTTTPFYFGETITTDLANYYGNYTYGSGPKGVYRKQTTEVGSFPPNAFGLYNMHGNVWEWCADPWHDNYEGALSDERVWEDEEKEEGFLAKLFGRKKEGKSNSLAVIRGGSWLNEQWNVRVTYRGRNSVVGRDGSVGFRLARL